MAMRRSLPRGVSWALWILYAIAILTESSHEQVPAASKCSSHADCASPGSYCRQAFQPSFEGIDMPDSRCEACSECRCHSYGIDGTCPSTCGIPADEIHTLQGTFFGSSTSFPDCLQVWTFSGSSFSSTSQLLNPPPDAPLSDEGHTTACPGSRDGGRRWGKFSIDASSYPSKISLVYADMSSESSQRLRTGFISSSCPEGIRLWWEEAGEGSTQLRAADSSTTEGGLAVYANLYFGVARIYTTVCDAHLKLELLSSETRLFRFLLRVVNCEKLSDPASEEGIVQPAEGDAARRSLTGRGDAKGGEGYADSVRGLRGEGDAIGGDWDADPTSRLLSDLGLYGRGESSRTRSRGIFQTLRHQTLRTVTGHGARRSDGEPNFCRGATQGSYSGTVAPPGPESGDILSECTGPGSYCKPIFVPEMNQTNYTCACEGGPGYGYTDACLPETQMETNCTFGSVCLDVDECQTGVFSCPQPLKACVNTNGSYTCECKPGYVLEEATGECVNLDECLKVEPCSPLADCTDQVPFFSCDCIQGYAGDGLVCETTTELMFDRITMSGRRLDFVMSWRYTAPPSLYDIIAIFKEGRQVTWFYTSATGCEYRAECAPTTLPEDCIMECRTVGSTINSWASNTLSAVESAGPGIYDLVAYSDVYRSVIAKTSAFVYHTNYTPPAGFVGSEFYVGEQAPPEGSNGTYQNGGLVGCGIAQVGGSCDAQGDVRDVLNQTVVLTTPPPPITTPPPNNGPVYSYRCGDGRLTEPEQCDDANPWSGDGCSNQCTVEVGFKCTYNFNPEFTFVDEDAGSIQVVGDPDSACDVHLYCGDGVVTPFSDEECDDRNQRSSDGCTDCKEDFGYDCVVSGGASTISICRTVIETDQSMFSTAGCPACDAQNGRCVYFDREVYCQCSPGYFLNSAFPPDAAADDKNPLLTASDIALHPQVCVNKNECLDGTHDCDYGAICNDTIGSYTCTCPSGTYGDGHTTSTGCTDVDECTTVNSSSATGYMHDCEANADCRNLFGSYTCVCRYPWEGAGRVPPGKACTRIPLCSPGTSTCSPESSCVLTDDGFECTCRIGLVGNGLYCYRKGFFEDTQNLWKNLGETPIPRAIAGIAKMPQLYPSKIPSFAGRLDWLIAEAGNRMFAHTAVIHYSPAEEATGDFLEYRCPVCVDATTQVVSKLWSSISEQRGLFSNRHTCSWMLMPTEVYSTIVIVEWQAFNLDPDLESITFCTKDLGTGQYLGSCAVYNSSFPPPSVPLRLPAPSMITLNILPGPRANPESGGEMFKISVNGSIGEPGGWDLEYLMGGSSRRREGAATSTASLINVDTQAARNSRADSAADLAATSGGVGFGVGAGASNLVLDHGRMPRGRTSQHSVLGDVPDGLAQRRTTSVAVQDVAQLAILNSVGLDLKAPCSFDVGYTSLWSDFRMNALPSLAAGDTRTPIEGSWSGTCGALPQGSVGQHTCDVTLQVTEEEFTLDISGCDPQTEAISGSGLIQRGPEFVGKVVNDFSGAIMRTFELLNFTFTMGGPSPSSSSATDRTCRASYFYEKLPLPSFELNLLPPGYIYPGSENGYPKHHAGTGTGQFPFRCQIMTLAKNEQTPTLAPPTPTTDASGFTELFDAAQKYSTCNDSLSSVYELSATSPECSAAVASAMSFSKGTDQGLATLNSACSSPCFEALNKTLHDGLTTCQLAWAPLVKGSKAEPVDGGGRDRFYTQLRAVFLSNVIAMADAVAWTRLACVSNYFGARCSVAAWQLASQVPKATCPSWTGLGDVTMPGGWAGAELTKDATCNPGCSQGLTTFAKVEGCCVGSIHEAKRMWWDAVVGIPSGDDDATAGSVSVDSDMFSCYARQGGTSCGAIPGGSQVMTLSRPSGSCASRQNGVTMNCYLSECRASMPAACCAGIECTNGGTRAYAGQCFCDCKPGFYGVDCALQGVYFSMTVQLVGVRAGEFDQDGYKSSLAVQLGLKQENIEMSTVKEVVSRRSGSFDDVVDGGTRSSQKHSRSNNRGGASTSLSRPHQRGDRKPNVLRQLTSTPYSLVVGIRVVGLDTRDLLRLTIDAKALIDSGSIGGYDLQADPKISGVDFGVKVVTGAGIPLCNKAIKETFAFCEETTSAVNETIYVMPEKYGSANDITTIFIAVGSVIFLLCCCCLPFTLIITKRKSRQDLVSYLMDHLKDNALIDCWKKAKHDWQHRGEWMEKKREERERRKSELERAERASRKLKSRDFGRGDTFSDVHRQPKMVSNVIPFAKRMAQGGDAEVTGLVTAAALKKNASDVVDGPQEVESQDEHVIDSHGEIGSAPDPKLQQKQQQPQHALEQLEGRFGRAPSEAGVRSSGEKPEVHDLAPPGFNEALDAQTKAIANLVEKQKDLLESQGRLMDAVLKSGHKAPRAMTGVQGNSRANFNKLRGTGLAAMFGDSNNDPSPSLSEMSVSHPGFLSARSVSAAHTTPSARSAAGAAIQEAHDAAAHDGDYVADPSPKAPRIGGAVEISTPRERAGFRGKVLAPETMLQASLEYSSNDAAPAAAGAGAGAAGAGAEISINGMSPFEKIDGARVGLPRPPPSKAKNILSKGGLSMLPRTPKGRDQTDVNLVSLMQLGGGQSIFPQPTAGTMKKDQENAKVAESTSSGGWTTTPSNNSAALSPSDVLLGGPPKRWDNVGYKGRFGAGSRSASVVSGGKSMAGGGGGSSISGSAWRVGGAEGLTGGKSPSPSKSTLSATKLTQWTPTQEERGTGAAAWAAKPGSPSIGGMRRPLQSPEGGSQPSIDRSFFGQSASGGGGERTASGSSGRRSHSVASPASLGGMASSQSSNQGSRSAAGRTMRSPVHPSKSNGSGASFLNRSPSWFRGALDSDGGVSQAGGVGRGGGMMEENSAVRSSLKFGDEESV